MKKIIDQIDEKIIAVLPGLKAEFSVGDFVAAFREKYPSDWKRLEERFTVEEKSAAFREWKKGPMPTPEKYLATAIKDFTKKNEKSVNKISNDRFKKTS
ncbi:MAG: hypothetical protein JW765_12290 [Deltaproteobacteria bacterium]|nr:hypothetical protein [Candidatus Zymogenaceae bacterium]